MQGGLCSVLPEHGYDRPTQTHFSIRQSGHCTNETRELTQNNAALVMNQSQFSRLTVRPCTFLYKKLLKAKAIPVTGRGGL
jgi:hypothetical protein